MSDKGPEILDLDKLLEDKRLIKLEGKEIDVSKIPSKITLEIANKFDDIDKNDPESMDVVMDLVLDIINSQNKEEITKDWLLENTDINQLIALLEFVMEPLEDKVDEAGNQKKTGQKK